MEDKIKDLKDTIKVIEDNPNLDSDIKRQCLLDMRDIVENLISDHDREQEGCFISINDFNYDDNINRFYKKVFG